MPRCITASDFPTFAACVESPTCISPAPSKGFRRCQNIINAHDRGIAATVREKILLSIENPTTSLEDDDLRKYAELSCCLRWHRAKVVDESVMNGLVCRWRNELTIKEEAYISITQMSAQLRDSRVHAPRASQSLATSRPRGNGHRLHQLPPITPHFQPWETNDTLCMLDIITEPLTERQKRKGWLYCASRRSDQDYHKAGCTTTRSVTRRIQKLQDCSGSDNPVTLDSSVKTANAHRAEVLLHTELQKYRREEQRCMNSSCNTKHREWFEVNVNIIKRTMSRWAQWLNEAEPYNEQGRLRGPWKRFCQNLQREGTPITSSELCMAWLEGTVDGEEDDDRSVPQESTSEEDSTDEDYTHHDVEEGDAAEEESEENSCPICLEAMIRPARTTCGHEFCSECIAQVFETQNRCPMCRAELVNGEVVNIEEAEIPMQNTTSVS